MSRFMSKKQQKRTQRAIARYVFTTPDEDLRVCESHSFEAYLKQTTENKFAGLRYHQPPVDSCSSEDISWSDSDDLIWEPPSVPSQPSVPLQSPTPLTPNPIIVPIDICRKVTPKLTFATARLDTLSDAYILSVIQLVTNIDPDHTTGNAELLFACLQLLPIVDRHSLQYILNLSNIFQSESLLFGANRLLARTIWENILPICRELARLARISKFFYQRVGVFLNDSRLALTTKVSRKCTSCPGLLSEACCALNKFITYVGHTDDYLSKCVSCQGYSIHLGFGSIPGNRYTHCYQCNSVFYVAFYYGGRQAKCLSCR